MIYETLNFLKEQLNNYYTILHTENETILPLPVLLENIAIIKEEQHDGSENIYITLVNLSEESTLKNLPNYRNERGSTVYENPPVFLNMFILFTSCFGGAYDKSLMHLSHLVEFFQHKNIFTHKNSSTSTFHAEEFKIIMDLYTPTFEQANYLWSTLGGKQFPYVLYKLRLTEVKRKDSINGRRESITQIHINEIKF
ncbi:MAG: DUF4255 domain-containing protein [Flavobacteriales bacterium]|nr:DUF4255 domain-containing protein [Flavobacteriales bacterium]